MTRAAPTPVGSADPFGRPAALVASASPRLPAHVLEDPATGRRGVSLDDRPPGRLLGTLPGAWPEWLGDRRFCEAHGTRFAYVTGSMANGIASEDLVIAAARAGLLGFFGAAGLSPRRVEDAIVRLARELGELPWGSNLIHAPNEPGLEDAVVDRYLRHGVRRVEASAFMALTPAVVRYAATGLRVDPSGRIVRPNLLVAKVSRPEVARRFFSPAPAELLDALVHRGQLTAEEARLARRLPLAEDVTAEADSGGHTDNRPLAVLLPTLLSLRDEVARAQGYDRPLRVGAAGGLGAPASVASAFALGAAYVLTGSVNQAAVESGQSAEARALLARAEMADVVMAPSADMFEQGVRVQVLQRGTMFAGRAALLYETYRDHASLEDLPTPVRAKLEDQVFRRPLAEVWEETRRFWTDREPREVAQADRDPRHRMALVFRWYLGLSSRWAITGAADRRLDYQIWCGPAMGAFNAWTRGSFLEAPDQRSVVQIAWNLLEGAAVVTRAQQLRTCGVEVPDEAFDPRPTRFAQPSSI